MVGGVGLLGIVGLGAVGGILANIALTPLTAGASLLQSYWYGSGLILGERMMYTVHWEKIKGRLDKGEDFLQVLDTIMNDDITAIANLSFKAMDETGKLYLDKAGTSIAALIEKLLLAILGSPVDVDVEPAPPGETTPEGITLTIAEIQAMSTNTLLFETQPNQITKYTEATQAHMLTEKLSRDITTETTTETAQIHSDAILSLLNEETAFVSNLQTITLANLWNSYIPLLKSDQQTKLLDLLRAYGITAGMSTRFASSGSDATRLIFVEKIIRKRTELFAMPVETTIDVLQTFYNIINKMHFMVYVWNLVYSR